MTTDHDDTASSPTDHAITELQLHGYRPFQDEPDPRPLPEGRLIAGAVADIFDALIVSLRDTRLEPDLDDLLWSTVHLFHRGMMRIERKDAGGQVYFVQGHFARVSELNALVIKEAFPGRHDLRK